MQRFSRWFVCGRSMATLPINVSAVYEARDRLVVRLQTALQVRKPSENRIIQGAHMIRGALNAVRHCSKQDPVIVTHSSGNHAQAVAMAARLCGYEAHVVMPKASLQVKKQGVLDLGAQVSLCENYEQSRQEVADRVLSEVGSRGVFISPVNHPDVMAGQGAIALEFLQQVPELDAIVVSVGGGGMISGIAVAAKAVKPGFKVIAAEPLAANDCYNSLKAGRIIPNPTPPDTICDALLTTIKELPWSVMKEMVDGVITVTDEVITSMKYIMERMKLVIEPSAACPLAAVLKKDFTQLVGTDVKNIGIVLCGGNVDFSNLLKWS